MNEILTAKEWLKREIEEHSLMGWDNSFLMERYANYRTKMLESKIKKFRNKMSKSWYENSEGKTTGDWIEEFDKYFNLNIK